MDSPTPEQVAADRARLTAYDPVAMLIEMFVDSGAEELEVECPEPGTVLSDGARFLDTPDATPVKMHMRFYTIAQRGHWLKRDVWIRKRGRKVILTSYDPKGRTG